MILAFFILAALLAVAVLIAWQLGKRAQGLARQVTQLGAELGKRDHIIKAMEAANAEANARKDSMASGSDADRFAASLDVLHDIAGGAKPAAADVAGVAGPAGKHGPG
jgi:hypothetical protein